MIDRREMKIMAKEAMKGRKPSVYLVGLVFLVITNILSELTIRIQFGGEELSIMLEQVMAGEAYVLPSLPIWGSILLLAVSVMSSVIGAGFQYYSLLVSRRQKAGVGEIFDVFGMFFKVFGLLFMMGLFVMLWSLLFVIPGIVANYRYSMAIYILMDDPNKGIMQCIRESKAMTNGYKWDLFVLNLSFIGWAILVNVPTMFAGISVLVATIGSILISAYVTPYMQISYANYYNRLSGWKPESDVVIEE